eukprot:CAMPEP_0116570926 /NCGR_PEP_ID=MMETSP0397-20121206/17239_1 /TAXON_ID=216820 /ORGANISM="Cyclophora tenuis, Strain ECT3854" /LENGTH=270 /DNA_ID=CAMNT_0004098893 /DNA_START=56 /DNA_END=869 /DNA_ORIENTATION=+
MTTTLPPNEHHHQHQHQQQQQQQRHQRTRTKTRQHRRNRSAGSAMDGYFIPGITGKARCLESESYNNDQEGLDENTTRSTSRQFSRLNNPRTMSSSTLLTTQSAPLPRKRKTHRRNRSWDNNSVLVPERPSFFIPGINGPPRCLDGYRMDEQQQQHHHHHHHHHQKQHHTYEERTQCPSLAMSSLSGQTSYESSIIHVQPIPYGESFEQISSAPSETCSRRTTQARTHTTNNVIIIEKAYNKGNEQREREAKMKRKKGRKKQRYALRNII